MIFTEALAWHSFVLTPSARDALTDLERVFRVVDGQRPSDDFRCEIVRTIGESPRRAHDYETDYFMVRLFANRNMHVYIRRLDVLERVNQHLALAHSRGIGWRGSA